MNLRPRRHEEVEINLIPMIDVLLMLVIFFAVSTTFHKMADLKITLPEASKQAANTEPKAVDVVIDADAQFYIAGQKTINSRPETIKRVLHDAARGEKDPQIVIKADAKTPHQAVITVMDAARQLGFVRLSFATTQHEEPKTR